MLGAGRLRLVDGGREEVGHGAGSGGLDGSLSMTGLTPLSPNARATPIMAIIPWMAARLIMNASEREWLNPSENRSRWNASRSSRPRPHSSSVALASSPVSSHVCGDHASGAHGGTRTVMALRLDADTGGADSFEPTAAVELVAGRLVEANVDLACPGRLDER